MLFNTLAFAIFMTVVFLVYWIIPHKFRWMVLLAANIYFFFSFDVKYLLLLFFTILISYFVGLGMEKQGDTRKKKLLFAAGLGTPLLLLFIFKYAAFTFHSLEEILQGLSIPMWKTTIKLVMPVGISFYTFQIVGYLTDIYRGKISAEHHLGKYAVFVSFFPNISSGPIERAGNFIPQLEVEKQFDYDKVVYGSRLLLWGLIKKIVVADQLSKYVDVVFDNVYEHTGIVFALATLVYTFQIYFDFSGYSDMAIGLAKMLGFDLTINFKSPYFATSIKEFWSRWHISLSTWFRDYVYISLGGNRVSKWRRSLNLVITFLVSGLWHGADWTFVLWGGIHGVVQVVEKTMGEAWDKVHPKENLQQESEGQFSNIDISPWQRMRTLLCTLITFCVVSYAWMFFRANSISDAWYMVRNMFTDWNVSVALQRMAMDTMGLIKVGGATCFILIFDYFNQKADMLASMNKLPAVIRWGIYTGAALVVLVLCMHGGVSQQFIYFNF